MSPIDIAEALSTSPGHCLVTVEDRPAVIAAWETLISRLTPERDMSKPMSTDDIVRARIAVQALQRSLELCAKSTPLRVV